MVLEVIRDSAALQAMFYVFIGAGIVKCFIRCLPNILRQFKDK